MITMDRLLSTLKTRRLPFAPLHAALTDTVASDAMA